MSVTETQASELIAEVLGETPLAVEHMTFGHNSVTYEVTLEGRTLILRTNNDAGVFRKTEHNLHVLRGLELPVPEVITSDLEKARYPVAYMLLNKIPGRDLRYELPGMTLIQQDMLAKQIAAYQQRVATLPEGKGFGYAPLGEAAPFGSWFELVVAETRRNLSPQPTPEESYWQARVFGLLGTFAPYLSHIRPIPFLDDLTTKNVLIERGELQGLIDFDVVCYGDPLWTLGLTGCALVTDVGLEELSYLEALCRAYRLDEEQQKVVRLYASLFALTFFAHAGPDEVARLIEALEMWTADLTG